jgi:Family of unknown function (DUF6131)
MAPRSVSRLGWLSPRSPWLRTSLANPIWSTHVGKEPQVIILGIILVVIGVVASIPILETIGVILLVVGAILWVLGSMGRAVGGRKHYY